VSALFRGDFTNLSERKLMGIPAPLAGFPGRGE